MFISKNLVNLDDLDLIQVTGIDSFDFLQSQLTADLKNLSLAPVLSTKTMLSGFCTPQGRLLASFWISRSEIAGEDIFYLWISKDIAESFVKRLKMFVLRSKVLINYQPNRYKVYGFFGDPEELSGLLPDKNNSITNHISNVNLNNQIFNRSLIAILNDKSSELINNHLDFWMLLEVLSGIPRITDATKDHFVPQMINFESLNGVGFQKGCYPGQEIIARSQYRGTIKRRLYIYSSSTNLTKPLRPGQEIYDSNDLTQPAGMVVLSAFNGLDSKTYFQVSIKTDSAQNVLVINDDGNYIDLTVVPQQLPYELLVI
jgi:folate-binding protein YgfZ